MTVGYVGMTCAAVDDDGGGRGGHEHLRGSPYPVLEATHVTRQTDGDDEEEHDDDGEASDGHQLPGGEGRAARGRAPTTLGDNGGAVDVLAPLGAGPDVVALLGDASERAVTP